jgi:hypothetical protein
MCKQRGRQHCFVNCALERRHVIPTGWFRATKRRAGAVRSARIPVAIEARTDQERFQKPVVPSQSIDGSLNVVDVNCLVGLTQGLETYPE